MNFSPLAAGTQNTDRMENLSVENLSIETVAVLIYKYLTFYVARWSYKLWIHVCVVAVTLLSLLCVYSKPLHYLLSLRLHENTRESAVVKGAPVLSPFLTRDNSPSVVTRWYKSVTCR